jgi:16S rRNA (cytosine1402-N4)-methyltransferase
VEDDQSEHKRRARYSGSHPRSFKDKYKELDPERYAEEADRVRGRGQTPAGTHVPICVSEILGLLAPAPGETGLDATMGYGGHSRELLSRIQPGGRLVCLDVDPIEAPKTEARLREFGYPAESLIVKRMNFSGLAGLCAEAGFKFDFALADLGLSSMQIDNPERGFTFKESGPLDLRLDPSSGMSAAQLLSALDEQGLAALLRDNADEPYSYAIAKSVLAAKAGSTDELAAAVERVIARLPQADKKEETARACQRVFQALRIAVNDEFGALDRLLEALPAAMKPGGRIAILSFHSGEDRRVKKAFKAGLRDGAYASIAPDPVRPGAEERRANPRSASAKLRWAILA